MKTQPISKTLIIILFVAAIIISCTFSQQSVPSDAAGQCLTGTHALNAAVVNSWFESGSVTLNGAVKPANSVTFPDAPNCTFYNLLYPFRYFYLLGNVSLHIPFFPYT